MVYFESSDLGMSPHLKNWFDTLPKDIPEHGIKLLKELFEFSLEKGWNFTNLSSSTLTIIFFQASILYIARKAAHILQFINIVLYKLYVLFCTEFGYYTKVSIKFLFTFYSRLSQ